MNRSAPKPCTCQFGPCEGECGAQCGEVFQGAPYDGAVCTRPLGHEGEHEATIERLPWGNVEVVWLDEA